MADTAINQLFDKAPARRVLKGDKRKPEAAEHIIEFPGGAIEIARLDDGTYWAHIIIINQGAEVVSSRVDWAERRLESIPSLPDATHLTQIAVRIRPDASNAQ